MSQNQSKLKLSSLIKEYNGLIKDVLSNLDESAKKSFNEIPSIKNNSLEKIEDILSRDKLKIALYGEFSTGKSTLVNALIDHISFKIETDDLDEKFKVYDGLIPTGRTQTTSCVLKLYPHPEQKYKICIDYGEKTDEDSLDKPNEVSELLRSYGTFTDSGNDKKANRISVGIPQEKMGVSWEIYDLPGLGGEHDSHREMVEDNVRNSDCIIYTCSIDRELSESELFNLKTLNQIAGSYGKILLFVITQIDKVPNFKDRPFDVLEKNNRLLKQYLSIQDNPFIVSEFIGVSAGRYAQYLKDKNKNKKFLPASGIQQLRENITELRTDFFSPTKYSLYISKNIYPLLMQVEQYLRNIYQANHIKYENLNKQLDLAKKSLSSLQRNLPVLEKKLQDNYEKGLKTFFITLDSRINLLKESLDSDYKKQVEKLNPLKKKDLQKLIDLNMDISNNWLQESNGDFQRAYNYHREEANDIFKESLITTLEVPDLSISFVSTEVYSDEKSSDDILKYIREKIENETNFVNAAYTSVERLASLVGTLGSFGVSAASLAFEVGLFGGAATSTVGAGTVVASAGGAAATGGTAGLVAAGGTTGVAAGATPFAILLANPLTLPATGAVAVVSLGILGYRSHLKGIARIEDAREVMVKEIDKHVARTKETIRFIHEASTKEYCLTLLNLCTQDIFSANTFITSLETRIDSDNSLIAKNLKFSSEAQEKLKNLRHTSDKLKNELDLFLDQSNSKLFLRNES